MVDNNENNRMMDGCNCVNCRLGRIEEQLDHIKVVLEASQPKKSKN